MPVAAPLSPGSVFAGDFRIIDLLAEGGMGSVYRAEQLSTRKTRALKLVHARLAGDPKGRERFVREATVGAAIESEHIVEVIGAGVDEGSDQPWLAMELLEGADLGSLCEHRGPLSAAETVAVLRQLCHGLAAAHRAGVVHRDLKPANIFVARSRRAGPPFTVKILDFGIAKVVEGGKSGATETETVGSPMWMAPEQLNAQRPTPATDVWALGLIAFWVLTGKHYWRAAHVKDSRVQALFVEQLFKPLEPASDRATEYGVTDALPAGFDVSFDACLRREPRERLANAQLAIEHLEEVLDLEVTGPAAADAVGALLPDAPVPPSQSAVARVAHQETVASPADTTTTNDPALPASSAFEPTLAADEGFAADLSRADLAPAAPLPVDSDRRRVWPLLGVGLAAAAIVAGGAWWAVTGGPWHETEGVVADADAGANDEDPPVDDTGAPTSETSPPPGLPTIEPPPPPPAADADAPGIELVVPLRHQPSFASAELRFMGWSADSRRFVVRATHHPSPEDDPLVLVQVHDAVTGAMVESFAAERPGRIRSRYRGEFKRLAQQAHPAAEFEARRIALDLVRTPSTTTPASGATLEITIDEATAGTTLRTRGGEKGFAFDWRGFTFPPPEGAARTRGPMMRTWLRTPTPTGTDETSAAEQSRWPLLAIRPPFRYADLAARITDDAPTVRVTGRIDPLWSPDGRRVLLLVRGQPQPRDKGDAMRSARWFLRAVGPQIRVVEAGAGQQVARQVANRLEGAGLPTATVSLREPLVAHSEIYYRQSLPNAEALASRIQAALPRELGIEAVTEDGWTAAVVVLGQDLAP